ncbi:hypothetical protein CFK38_07885 [Brachybacterium vulturis]|uniref:Uncharacterized protein n=1 Tax=Brachybacterium vulturis TaxID=2017484 RepID=A0A291GMN6_9MICO|nr:hypothetical protein [Brachybacterium vulturis]ATG51458.1 hypothetical protein CFK38_07885 [Brachybacterium vulturis]
MIDVEDGEHMVPSRPVRRARRAGAALASAVLAFSLSACDALPGRSGSGAETSSPAAAEPMDPAAVAAAESTPVDPSWLCRPGAGTPPVASTAGGTLTPQTVRAEGNVLEVSGRFRLEADHHYRGFAPVGVLVPADPENRGLPAPGFEGELGIAGAPVPPIVVRERVEVSGDGPAPSAVTAHLTLGTCDDSPLPDGQFLLRLRGGGIDGPGRGEADAGWSADGDVLVDVVDGAVEVVPGVVTAPSGEVPVDLSPLQCGARLVPLGEGDELTVEVADPTTRVSTRVPEDELGVSVSAQVTVTSPDLGTRALFQGVVLTHPGTGTVVAEARNTPRISLQWIDEDGVTRTGRAWTTREACGPPALRPGEYRAHAFAVTVDEDGATRLVLSDPWSVEIVDEQPDG